MRTMKAWLKHSVGIAVCSTVWGLLPFGILYLLVWNTKLAPFVEWPLLISARSILVPGQWLSDVVGFSGHVGWVICSLAWGILIWCTIVLVRRLIARSSELRTT